MDLFEQTRTCADNRQRPLAARMRPRCLDDIVGQDRIIGPGKLLRRAIEADRLSSLILYGPPGCGKTSIAEVIARATERRFERTSGALSNVQELRALLGKALHFHAHEGQQSILFIDEIHRFNKAQQDVLLHHVEEGAITLVGATTHNPLFFINSPLTSRSLIFELEPLSPESIQVLLRRALDDPEQGLGATSTATTDGALEHLAVVCEGDARRALNALEIAVLTTEPGPDGVVQLTGAVIEDSVQKKVILYDHDEDGHYDTISAYIKSIRGSDPNAAVYWLAKMLYAGEDPRFVARRLVILASEDVGNADPRGLILATAALRAVEFVGMPESRIILAQATTYLATAPKSNASYLAIDKAGADVEAGRVLPVPEHLKNIHVRAEGKADAEAYRYAHDYEGHVVDQEYVPTDATYYEPTQEGYEDIIGKRLARWDALRKQARGTEDDA